VQGFVTLFVITRRGKVETAKVLRGDPILAEAAESNIRTWLFNDKMPTKVQVIYQYEISEHCVGYPSVTLTFPSFVHLCSKPIRPVN